MEFLASFLEDVRDIVRGLDTTAWLRALLLIIVGMAAARLLGAALYRAIGDGIGSHRVLILRRVLSYGILALFLVAALHEVGFELSVLLGAAGILTVAIGFASQTAASNLVSGLFLIGEAPFEVGEVIKIGSTTGEVISIDLLSVKLRTFDNLLVRIPNENVMKAEVVNMTRFPVRRYDLLVRVGYRHDLDDVEKVLLATADVDSLCLDEPKPIVIVLGFGDSGVDVQLSAWALRANFLAMRNSLHRGVKKALEEAGIEIPYPHRTLITRAEDTPVAR